LCIGVITELVADVSAVPLPIAIKSYLPEAFSRKPDVVTVVAAVGNVGHNYHVISRTAIFPAVKCDDLVVVVDMVDVYMLPMQTTRIVVPITA
jgi:hypothetical protein